MKVPFVDLKAQYHSIKEEIDSSIHHVLDNTSFIGGQLVREFEQTFAGYIGIEHCVSCANGTDAIEIALQALGIGPGDEVIVPAMSWISTAEAVNTVGATPVFVDVLEKKHTINPALIAEKITPSTRAIIPVHLYGRPADMVEVMDIAARHNLKVIEDCAQAHGAQVAGQTAGTFGDAATFSFYPGKNLGAYGDAGCIITHKTEVAEKCRMIANHGQKEKHQHQMTGRNSRMDTLQAAVLGVKLRHIERWTNQRIAHAEKYNDQLEGAGIPLPDRTDVRHVFHLYVVQLHNRDEVKARLAEKGIATQVHYPQALPLLPPYAGYNKQSDYAVAAELASCGLSLPMYPELTTEQIEYVCSTLRSEIK